VDAPGRAFGSTQTDAFKQHNHGITDPGHNHDITDPQHNHGITDPQHAHGITDPQHTHANPAHGHTVTQGDYAISTATVVGNDNGLYRGNRNQGFQTPTSEGNMVAAATSITINNATTGVTVNAASTGVTVNDASTGVTVNNNTTGITTNNTPVTAPTPDETRPKNVALLPIIKYTDDF